MVESRNLTSSALVVTTPWPGTTVSKLSARARLTVAVHSLALPPPE